MDDRSLVSSNAAGSKAVVVTQASALIEKRWAVNRPDATP